MSSNLRDRAVLASLLVCSMMLVVVAVKPWEVWEDKASCRLPRPQWTTDQFKNDTFRKKCMFDQYLKEYKTPLISFGSVSPKAKSIWRALWTRHLEYLMLKSECTDHKPLPLQDENLYRYPELEEESYDRSIIEQYRAQFGRCSEGFEGGWNIDRMRGLLIIMAYRQAELSHYCKKGKIYINQFTDYTCEELDRGEFCTFNDQMVPRFEPQSSDSDDH